MVTHPSRGGTPPLDGEFTWSIMLVDVSFIRKDLGFVQTRDQELSIALFKSINVQLQRKLDLTYFC